ncbi:MAG TPA: hypothetical protein VKF41_02950 [Bryobacteraceae bacterium]|nr:hypothetical protein [Bryobacteraceae bacterium]
MARKRTESEQAPALPALAVPRVEAAQKIRTQIEKGYQLRDLAITSQSELDTANAQRSKWSSYNTELLKRLFDNTSMANEYNYFGGCVIPGNTDLY